MNMKTVRLSFPENCNIIVGQSHFMKTIEDLYEIFVTGCPHCKFGIAFCEASQDRLVRVDGNDEDLSRQAADNAMKVGAGHSFICILKDAFPINVLNAIKSCAEVCTIFCATANPVELIVAETDLGRGILGVVDGQTPKGIEKDSDVEKRKEFLRMIGYKK
ncbi:MAG: adenosine-specific kinase [Acidobacteriota bacterium]|jgi:adenosine/AMP kinase